MQRIVLILAVIMSGMSLAINGDLGDGEGSWDNPYLIQDFNDFQEFCSNPYYWYDYTRLECDLDLSAIGSYSYAPIAADTSRDSGFQGTAFYGSFDGNRHVIRHLTIDGDYRDYVGLFGAIGDQGQIYDLGVEDANMINVNSYGGGLCGYNLEGSIQHCYSTGEVKGNLSIGGLCGRNDNSIIGDCYSIGVVKGSAYIGGLCGYNKAGLIINSYSAGETKGVGGVGGLSGYNVDSGAIRNSFSANVVSGTVHVGGLCGLSSSHISNSYSTGTVTGSINVGGLCGFNPGYISRTYSTSIVTGETDTGGLVGRTPEQTGGTVNNSFWDMEASGITVSDGGDGKTTEQMQELSIFTEAEWDFSGNYYYSPPDWMMLREGEDYPRLAWQTVYPGDIAGLYGVDMADVAYLSSYWQVDCSSDPNDCGRADIDDSGDVGIGDLTELVNDWLLN